MNCSLKYYVNIGSLIITIVQYSGKMLIIGENWLWGVEELSILSSPFSCKYKTIL